MKSVLSIMLIIGGISVVIFTMDQFDILNSPISKSTFVPEKGNFFISTTRGDSWGTTKTNDKDTSFTLNALQYWVEGHTLNMLAGTNQGLFLSNNDGLDWRSAFREKVGTKQVYDIVIDFMEQPAMLYIATQDSDNNLIIFRSNNGGDSFKKLHIGSHANQSIVGIEADLGDKNTVYVLLSDGSFLKSTDNGDSWQHSQVAPGKTEVFHYFLSNPIYEDVLFAITQKNVYMSIDNGNSWRWAFVFEGQTIQSAHISNTSGYIYIGTEKKLYISKDTASSFDELNFNFIQDDTTPIRAIFTNPQNNALYVGAGQTIYETKNEGTSWSIIKVNNLAYNINVIWIHPQNQQIMYVGSQSKQQ